MAVLLVTEKPNPISTTFEHLNLFDFFIIGVQIV